MPELKNTIGAELLKVHVSYGPLVQKLLQKFNAVPVAASRESADRASAFSRTQPQPIKTFAHITGGGFVDNIPRVLPKNCDVVIRKRSWDMLPIFKMIETKSGVPDAELYQVFNMGIGMVTIVSSARVDAVLEFIRAQKHRAWLIGKVVKGNGEAWVV